MGDLTLFKALTGGAFDRLNWQHSGVFDQNFSKKSNARGFARGGGGGGMGGFGINRYIKNGVKTTPKRRLLTLMFACLGFKKSLTIQKYEDMINHRSYIHNL